MSAVHPADRREGLRPELRVGIDLCRADEVNEAVEHFGDHYLHRVYTEGELAYCLADPHRQSERLAARFAAKEALLKVLRQDDDGIDLRNIEVVRQPGGWCQLELSGHAKEVATRDGIRDLAVSLSHERGIATAVVIAHADPPQPREGHHEQ